MGECGSGGGARMPPPAGARQEESSVTQVPRLVVGASEVQCTAAGGETAPSVRIVGATPVTATGAETVPTAAAIRTPLQRLTTLHTGVRQDRRCYVGLETGSWSVGRVGTTATANGSAAARWCASESSVCLAWSRLLLGVIKSRRI